MVDDPALETAGVENSGSRTKTLMRVLILGSAVIFVGGEIADALIAKMPGNSGLIKACVAALVGALWS